MTSSKKIENQLVDHLTSEGEPNNPEELKSWLSESDENQQEYRHYQRIWEASGKLGRAGKYQVVKAWSNVDYQIKRKQQRKARFIRFGYVAMGAAASLVLILALAFYTGQFSLQQNNMQLTTAYGSRTEVVLPDGSKVKLNSGSELQYHFNPLSKTREVALKGEGFFQVAKSGHSFHIQTPQGMELKVLGTTFNISAYPEDKVVHTALVEGSVELSNPKNQKVVLIPGQIMTFNIKDQSFSEREGKLSHIVGWTENKIYLDRTSLEATSVLLERWFDVSIRIIPEELGKDIHYTGVLEEKDIRDVLHALSELSEIKYSIEGNEILVRKR